LSRIKPNNGEKLTKDDKIIYSHNYIGKVKSFEIEHEVTQKNLFKPMSDKIHSEEIEYDFEEAKRKDQKKHKDDCRKQGYGRDVKWISMFEGLPEIGGAETIKISKY
jgi:hypothetical protein